MLGAVSALCFSAGAGSAQFQTCYARWSDHELVLGNSHFERKWRIQDGRLTATSFRNLHTGTEWIRQPDPDLAPLNPVWRAEVHDVSISARNGRMGVTGEAALQVLVTAKRATNLVCRFVFFPMRAAWKHILIPTGVC